MARFRFELQVVLEHRQRIEQERQKAVAELDTQRVGLETVIRRCQEGLATERVHTRTLLEGSDLRGVRYQVAATTRLTATAQRAVLELAGVHKRLEAARAALLEAAKNRKAVELLRDKRWAEWMEREKKLEAAAVDELAVMRARHGGDTP